MADPSAKMEGRVAVVTGGASGIGEGIVAALIEAGAKVAVGDRDADRLTMLEGRWGSLVATRRCDVRVEHEVAALVAAATDLDGVFDAAFNVAGVGCTSLITEMPEREWDRSVDVCLKGTFLALKHEARAMQATATEGAIVNITSVNDTMAMHGGSAYCSAKAGVRMLTRCAALELGADGIRVNSIAPGLIETPLTSRLIGLPGALDAYLERIPLQETGTPADIAKAALFLAGPESRYISGTELRVDGAWEGNGYPDMRPFLTDLRRD